MKQKINLYSLTAIGCSLIFFNQGINAADNPQLQDFVADGFDLPVSNIMENNYGYEYAQPWEGTTLHSGIDLNTDNRDCGRQVKAVANGIVVQKGHAGADWGGVILLQHRFYHAGGTVIDDNDDYLEYTTQYGHIAPLDSINAGDHVYRGQTIGYIAKGNNALCETFPGVTDPHNYDVNWGAHLHFEVRVDETLSYDNWNQNLTRTGTGPERKTIMDDLGYFLPFSSPYATDILNGYSQSAGDNAMSWFGENTEADSFELGKMKDLNLMTYTEDNVDDPRRHNKNHVLTKRQVTELIARTLSQKMGDGVPANPVQYAVNQGLINASSPNQADFDDPVRRDVAFIIAARADQVLTLGATNNLSNCTSSRFNDITINSSACKYANYLYDNLIFKGYINGQQNFAAVKAYATRDFTAKLNTALLTNGCNDSVDLNSSVLGSWQSSCASASRSGRYAKYISFTLLRSQSITVDLKSSTDTYMYLLNGLGKYGSRVDKNDDGGDGLNSRLSLTLEAGTYTIEATTYSSGKVGSFSVSIQ